MKTCLANARFPIFPCLLTLLATGIVSCTEDRRQTPRRFLPGTSDVLYVDSVRYLLDRSPLCGRRGYDKLFPRFSYTEVFPGVPGLTGPPDKLYSAVWVLSGDSLLLVGLDYSSDRSSPMIGSLSSDACAAFEKWLGRTFGPVDERALRNHLPFGIVSPGTLHADWTTGVFYRKRAVLSRDEDIGRWIGAPFERMTFEKGRLLGTDTLPFTEEERIGRDRKMKKLLKRIEKRMPQTTRSPFGEIRRDAPKAGRDRFDVSSITLKTERL